MPSSPSILQWLMAFILLALFSWTLLSLLWDIVPTPWINTNNPQKKRSGSIVLLVIFGLLNYSLTSEVLVWVWMGIRHLLGFDLEGL